VPLRRAHSRQGHGPAAHGRRPRGIRHRRRDRPRRHPRQGKHVFAIDPNPWKQQQALDFGATHAFGDPVKGKEVLIDLTRGQLADRIKLTELITKKYALDEINDGYQDLMDGKNIRGVVVHQH
jgi:Zn-dependent alcohol dehydrogenase